MKRVVHHTGAASPASLAALVVLVLAVGAGSSEAASTWYVKAVPPQAATGAAIDRSPRSSKWKPGSTCTSATPMARPLLSE